jgi:hypothetical protein
METIASNRLVWGSKFMPWSFIRVSNAGIANLVGIWKYSLRARFGLYGRYPPTLLLCTEVVSNVSLKLALGRKSHFGVHTLDLHFQGNHDSRSRATTVIDLVGFVILTVYPKN